MEDDVGIVGEEEKKGARRGGKGGFREIGEGGGSTGTRFNKRRPLLYSLSDTCGWKTPCFTGPHLRKPNIALSHRPKLEAKRRDGGLQIENEMESERIERKRKFTELH